MPLVFSVSSLALLLVQALALNVQRGAQSQSPSLMSMPPQQTFEADKDGTLPEHPSYISDPKTKVVHEPELFSQQEDIFMRYMPEKDVVMCGCGKCGSTSMLEYVYDQIFPATWAETWKGKGPPYVQEILSDKWQGQFEMVTDQKEQDAIMNKAFSFALIRDPKERIVSAWKSKLACENWGVDLFDRSHYDGHQHQYKGFVAHIQRLRGQDENITCMPLEMFAEALLDIKKLGRSSYLDRHFLAQDLGCFYRFPPERWNKVTTITAPDAFVELAGRLGSENSTMYSMHASPWNAMITPKIMQLLDEVTADEYKMLGPYLSKESSVKVDMKPNGWSCSDGAC